MSGRFYNVPDPALPGWNRWGQTDDTLFYSLIGELHIRSVDATRAEIRFDPPARLGNEMGALHGGGLLGFLDIALFGGCAALDACDAATSLTVELNTHFLAPGRHGIPIIAEFEIMRSTRRLLFARGLMRQDGEALLQYNTIIRKGPVSA